jgi:group I intron endonuclease
VKDQKLKSGVYKIVSPEGRTYIGSSRDVPKRLEKYRNIRDIRQPLLRESLEKHGYENHKVEIEYCSKEVLFEFERRLGVVLDALGENGLNSVLPSDGKNPAMYRPELIQKFSDRRHSTETRNKMSASKMGANHHHSRKVVHVPTGSVYGSVREAAEAHGVNQFSLARWLRNGKKYEFEYKTP